MYCTGLGIGRPSGATWSGPPREPLRRRIGCHGRENLHGDAQAGKIRRGNLDGAAVEDLDNPTSIAVEATARQMYCAVVGVNKIQRGNLDGPAVKGRVTSGLEDPYGIALDATAGKMFWV